MIALLFLAACDSGESVAAEVGPIDVVIGDDHQFVLEASIVPSVVELDLSAEVSFDWHGLGTDVYGRSMSANGERAEAWLFAAHGADMGELLDGLANERLDQAALSLFTTCLADEPVCALRDFRLLDGANDVPERLAESGETWGLVLINPVDGGLGAVHQVVAGDGVGQSAVELSAPSRLELSVELGESKLAVPAGTAALRVDWGAVIVDGLGGDLASKSVDSLFVVHSSLAPDALAEHIYDLDGVVDARWSMPIGREASADLSELAGTEPFTGVTDSGTWALGLSCGNCATPAPRLFTVLTAAE